ncbi:type II secretion system protein [Parapedobacter koreensis]|uniref:Prepilin-type N-terminal cleavage/methylation domain-containing protein n=1 Tax=Parapedobacter koreensis TaxID=332977 RepID=A0A1H7I0F0_9SPHI|nr:prepilin-type N-terminal cleavage/methylation domain-containing protein [Parapedobacter koreensis]SEK54870.1 hypothetical protein SAMN05421740_10247 [Parapedobacter koreensis]
MAAPLIAHRLKASTLVEVLVALVIITLVMAIAATLYAKMGLNRPDNLVNLQLELKAIAAEAKRNRRYDAGHYQLDNGVRIDKEVTPYQTDTLLLLLELKAYKQGTGEVAVYREIIIKDQ